MIGTEKSIEKISADLGIDEAYFLQTDILQLVENPFNKVWTTVYQFRSDLYSVPAIFSCTASIKNKDIILEGTDWIRNSESFAPGFCCTNTGTYYTDGKDDGYDFLVSELHFHPFKTSQLLINPEFIMLFGLFLEADGSYYAIDECGNKEKAIDIKEDSVRFKTNFLMRYIAAKQVLYVQFVDSRRSSAPAYPTNAKQIANSSRKTNSYHYEIWYQSTSNHDYLFSLLYARSVVYPKDTNTCQIWPYLQNNDEDYPEFIVEELPDGSFRRFSCNPSKLRQLNESSTVAPYYLTPVFFKPEVLDRYRNNPCFEITERRLSCGTQWSVEIDNVIPSRVMVYLGDLGRDVPTDERAHFLIYEIPPTDQHVSEAALLEDFFCSFDAPMGPTTALFVARDKLNNSWLNRFGHPLYRKFHIAERDIEKLIRIPSGNGRQEFDAVILNLTKYCIDYLDESILVPAKQAGGINRLEATLDDMRMDYDLSPLRDLQKIRSTCMAHAKGEKYEKLKRNLLTGDNPKDVSKLVGRLTSMMIQLASALDAQRTIFEVPQGLDGGATTHMHQ